MNESARLPRGEGGRFLLPPEAGRMGCVITTYVELPTLVQIAEEIAPDDRPGSDGLLDDGPSFNSSI